MKDLDFILSIYLFIYFIFFFLGVGAKVQISTSGKIPKWGGVLNLRQEKCDKSLNLLPILIYSVFHGTPYPIRCY